MSSPRNPKRARKKELSAQRRAALAQQRQRQQRRRSFLLFGTIGLLVLGVAAIVFALSMRGDQAAAPTPPPDADPTPAAVACDASVPGAAGPGKPSFDEPEDQNLDRGRTYVWRLDTSCGQVDIQLAQGRSPQTANSIVFLTRQNFFDGLTFHRVVRDFVIQGGDPLGDGTGGSGYKVTEAPDGGQRYTRGVVAMAKGGAEAPGTSGSQFFIVSSDTQLPAEYAFVGEVVAGMDVVDRIVNDYAGPGDGPPTATVYIERATIVER